MVKVKNIILDQMETITNLLTYCESQLREFFFRR